MANNNDRNDEKRYAKPGDDNIVSGKGFLISMPAFRKGNKNPAKALIDSTNAPQAAKSDVPGRGERAENAKENDRTRFGGKGKRPESGRDNGEKNAANTASEVRANGGANTDVAQRTESGEKRDGGRRSRNRRPQNRNEERNSAEVKTNVGDGENAKDAKGRSDAGNAKRTKGEAEAAAAEKSDVREREDGAKRGDNNRKRGGRGRNDSQSEKQNANRKIGQPEKNADTQPNGQQGKQPNRQTVKPAKQSDRQSAKSADGKQGKPNNGQQGSRQGAQQAKKAQETAAKVGAEGGAQAKKTANSRQNDAAQNENRRDGGRRRRGAEKVEKAAQAPRKAVSGATKNAGVGDVSGGGLFSAAPMRRDDSFFSRFDAAEEEIKGKKKKAQVAEAEPVLVDRNRPLAEQIEEEMKVRREEQKKMSDKTEVVGVRFRDSGKIYYFDPQGLKIAADSRVIVDTQKGIEYAFAAIGNTFVSTSKVILPLRPIIRTATPADTERYKNNKRLEAEASEVFKDKVAKLGLEMALVYVEYAFDNSKLIFYFTADGRVDFRELIKELASVFRTRIELRQIGVRDEAKLVGGLGICGRPVCCNTFLSDFSQVSIKMAKEQNLFLNSSKISGTCGRFMCCLKYEDESYRREYEITPRVGEEVNTPEGIICKVVESNALTGVVKAIPLGAEKGDGAPKVYDRSELTFVNPRPEKKKPEAAAVESADENPSGNVPEKSETSEKPEKSEKSEKKAEPTAGVVKETMSAVSDKAADAGNSAVKVGKSEKAEQAFADGIIKIDEDEAAIEAAILAEDYEIKKSELGDDFKVSSESTSKNSAFADGVISIEE